AKRLFLVPAKARDSRRLLIKTYQVPAGVAESGGDLGSVRPDGLHDFSSIGDDLLECRGYAVDHDIKQKAGIRRGRAPGYPGAAHLTSRIVKCGRTVPSFPHIPTEDLLVKRGRTCNVAGGHFDIADLAVRKSRGHRCSFAIYSIDGGTTNLTCSHAKR